MKDYPSRSMDQFQLRLPAGMREAVKELASENNRSMNSEIVFQLRRVIASASGNEKDRQGGNPDGLVQSQHFTKGS